MKFVTDTLQRLLLTDLTIQEPSQNLIKVCLR